MDNAAKRRVTTVEFEMRRGVGRRTILPFHHLAAHINHHHIVRFHGFVGNAAGLDHHQPAFAVDSADVAPGKGHQPVARQLHVGFKYLLF